jgi:hypothetical protein
VLALLEAFAEEPILADLTFFELPAAGPEVVAGTRRCPASLHRLPRPGRPAARRGEPTARGRSRRERIGIWAIVERAVVEGAPAPCRSSRRSWSRSP